MESGSSTEHLEELRMPASRRPDLKLLQSPEYMGTTILRIQQDLYEDIRHIPKRARTRMNIEESKKTLTYVDAKAEFSFAKEINKHFGEDRVSIFGEESIAHRGNLANESRICILVDMVDGTDLFERGFYNWCSAVVVFSPSNRKIIASFVVQPGLYPGITTIYYADQVQSKAIDVSGLSKNKELIGSNERVLACSQDEKDLPLSAARICAYAQNPRSIRELLQFFHNRGGRAAIDKLLGSSQRMRFYNLAGNPMMARLPEGIVHCVFDVHGQKAHDVVPGAFIALKAGAVIYSLDPDKKIDEDFLFDSIIADPNSNRADLKYIVSINKKIIEDFVGAFKSA